MYLIIKIIGAFILTLWLNISINNVKAQSGEITISKDSLVYFSKLQLGKNYNYANCSPKTGFDCSGFVYYVFTHFKVDVPRSSSQYSTFGKTIPVDSCITGDIIVFTGTNASLRSPGHVGIVLTGSPDLSFIHSSSDKRTSGVKISNFKDSPNYQKRFIKIVRVCKVI